MPTQRIKVLGRDNEIAINTGTAETPAWTKIQGLSTITFTFNNTTADTNDFDSNGWESHLVAMRSLEIALEGQAVLDATTKAPEPGQAAVELSSRLVGYEAFADYQVTLPSGATITVSASSTCTPFGGGVSDASKWTANLKVNGEPTWGAPASN